jgi:hypothetical protein
VALLAVLSQRTFKGAGDIDDCWVVATVWAYKASCKGHPGLHLPSITRFRAAAGDPDDGYRDGGTITEIMRGATRLWPTVPVIRFVSTNWTAFAGYVRAGRPVSLAVLSSRLPSHMRFGFYGAHQVGVQFHDGSYYVANPLAAHGSTPQRITATALRYAATPNLTNWNGNIVAAIFPVPYLGTVDIRPLAGGLPRPFRYWHKTPYGWTTGVGATRGLRLTSIPPRRVSVNGTTRNLAYLVGGSWGGRYVQVGSPATYIGRLT